MTGAEFEGVDIDLLADYVGGALDGTPDEHRVATLVAEDPAWRAAWELLGPAMTEVGAALGEFGPEPMPDELAARLDGLLRTPASEDADTGTDAPGVPAKVVDLGKARRLRRWAAPLSVAAALVAFAGFGFDQILDSAQTNADSAMSTTDSGEVTAAKAPFAAEVLSSGTDYTEESLADTPVPVTLSSGSSDSSGSTGEGGAPAGLSGSVRATDQSAKDALLSRLDDPDALRECIDAIARENAGGPITVELLDYARFNGRPAVIVRFSAANGLWAWAVGPDCGIPGAGASTLGNLPVR